MCAHPVSSFARLQGIPMVFTDCLILDTVPREALPKAAYILTIDDYDRSPDIDPLWAGGHKRAWEQCLRERGIESTEIREKDLKYIPQNAWIIFVGYELHGDIALASGITYSRGAHTIIGSPIPMPDTTYVDYLEATVHREVDAAQRASEALAVAQKQLADFEHVRATLYAQVVECENEVDAHKGHLRIGIQASGASIVQLDEMRPAIPLAGGGITASLRYGLAYFPASAEYLRSPTGSLLLVSTGLGLSAETGPHFAFLGEYAPIGTTGSTFAGPGVQMGVFFPPGVDVSVSGALLYARPGTGKYLHLGLSVSFGAER